MYYRQLLRRARCANAQLEGARALLVSTWSSTHIVPIHVSRAHNARTSSSPALNVSQCGNYALQHTSLLLGAAASMFAYSTANAEAAPEPESAEITNWSSTHTVSTERYYTPETIEELQALVRHAHENGESLRPVGSALSPNGLGLSSGGMVNLALMDKILWIDAEIGLVRVQAGARVSQVVEALRPYGLTLANYASITEQQIGGFTQVGAHGTGAGIPPVDEQVVAVRMVTPAAGVVEMGKNETDSDADALFRLARTSLGMLGVVAEITLQCEKAHRLIEQTFIATRSDVRAHHHRWISEHRHLRYMWIPYTDSVVVVTANVFHGSDDMQNEVNARLLARLSTREAVHAAEQLLLSHPRCNLSRDTVQSLSFTELRSELLRLDPLNATWVARVNAAEVEFWGLSQGTRVDWSDRILQFDCGGQQWVSEVVLPADDDMADIRYVEHVLRTIEEKDIAAPAPIEQRWTAASSSPLCAAGEKPTRELASLYSWVGIIMYLPDASEEESGVRDEIAQAFRKYKRECEQFWPKFRAVEHWAKIEMPVSDEERVALQLRMADKYPLEAFKAVRSLFDPKGILSTDLMRTLLDGATMEK